MTDYKPNSHKFKKEQTDKKTKKVDKIVSGKVKTKKKNELQKMAGNIVSEDVANVKSYILMDVLIPAVKDAIEDIVTNGIRMLLRGETGTRCSGSGVSKLSYNKVYDSRNDRRSSASSRSRTGYDFEDIVLETRGEAEDVLRHMDELIETYGTASVADLYDLVGIIGPYTNNKWGWTNLRTAEPIRVKDGYLLKLPKACPID